MANPRGLMFRLGMYAGTHPWWFGAGVLAVLSAVFLLAAGRDSEQPPASRIVSSVAKTEVMAAAAPDPALLQIRNQRVAREWVLVQLKDPASANFRNQFGLCGEVNSKNSYGGFNGFQSFIAAGPGAVIFETDDTMKRSEFVKAWNLVCVKK